MPDKIVAREPLLGWLGSLGSGSCSLYHLIIKTINDISHHFNAQIFTCSLTDDMTANNRQALVG